MPFLWDSFPLNIQIGLIDMTGLLLNIKKNELEVCSQIKDSIFNSFLNRSFFSPFPDMYLWCRILYSITNIVPNIIFLESKIQDRPTSLTNLNSRLCAICTNTAKMMARWRGQHYPKGKKGSIMTCLAWEILRVLVAFTVRMVRGCCWKWHTELCVHGHLIHNFLISLSLVCEPRALNP